MALSIVDSHIHLWPASAANSQGHRWMVDVPSLAKQHILEDYLAAVGDTSSVKGVVYIETDRRHDKDKAQSLERWASNPIDEIRFVRSIVEDGKVGDLLKGIVLWAPLDESVEIFNHWLRLAEETAGPEAWRRVKGFRFLLQAIAEKREFEQLVFSDAFAQNLESLVSDGRDFVFDVGIDQHNGGIFQLEAWGKVLEKILAVAPESRFIMNHLCKPDYQAFQGSGTTDAASEFHVWRSSMFKYASFPGVYMKLSGAFSELSDGRVNTTAAPELARRIRPCTDVIFEAFSPHKIMFGSDWPVCNIRGPDEESSWTVWRAVVQTILDERNLTPAEQRRIWSETASEAYRL